MLTCSAARRLLYAFADGELPVRENCDVLDHLKMCPDCARVVADQQALRAAIRTMTDRDTAPADFVARAFALVEPAGEAQAKGPRRFNLLLIPLGVAACLAILTFSFWRSFAPASLKPVSLSEARELASSDAAASRVVQVHEYCCNRHDHHEPSLPQALAGLSAAMSAHFNDVISVLAPDFSTSGFQFESANFCGFKPRNRGAHLIYVAHADAAEPKRLSFFSVPRWSYLDRCPSHKGLDDHDFRRFTVPAERTGYAIVAWHDNQTTYICCGEMSVTEMVSMVEPVRIAMHGRENRIALALASLNLFAR